MMKDDIAKVYFTEEELQAKVRELGRQITEDYKDAKEDIYCVGILRERPFSIRISSAPSTCPCALIS